MEMEIEKLIEKRARLWQEAKNFFDANTLLSLKFLIS